MTASTGPVTLPRQAEAAPIGGRILTKPFRFFLFFLAIGSSRSAISRIFGVPAVRAFSRNAGDSSIQRTNVYAMMQSATSRSTELRFQRQKKTGTRQMFHHRPMSKATPMPARV